MSEGSTADVPTLVTGNWPEKHPAERGLTQGGLVDRQQEPSGDYGYDLAHEATGRGRASEERPPDPEVERPPVDPRADQGQDLGYDEAHDF